MTTPEKKKPAHWLEHAGSNESLACQAKSASDADQAGTSKRTLEQHSGCSLCVLEKADSRPVHYLVETTEKTWQYNTFFQAEAKFNRLLAHAKKGGQG